MKSKVIVLAALLLAGPPAIAQSSGSIDIFDIMAPGERRRVTPDWAAINAQPLGSKGNPVRTYEPAGQRAYLQSLVCADGLRPGFRRIGNVGPGPYSSIVDAYEVSCETASYRVMLDMYHPGYVERRAVPGFTLRPPSKEEQFIRRSP